MIAEIISVGTEIILGSTLNTNAHYITKKLSYMGIDVYFHTTVIDDPKLLEDAINIGMKRSDLLIFTGGLGPTYDDMTKEVVAKTLGIKLILNNSIEENIKKYFEKTNRPMTSNNIKQAYMPEGSIILKNEIGTAPGIYIEYNSKIFILLPGPPKEMELMLNKYALPLIKQDNIIKVKTINTIGIGESALEDMLKDLIGNTQNPSIATYAKDGRVDIKIIVKGTNEEKANKLLENTIEKIDSKISKYIYSYEDESIEQTLYKKLLDKNMTIAFCESCTGGLIVSRFTRIPGVSQVLDRGIVTYSNKAKIEELGVKKETLNKYGAVSEQVAIEMAMGLLNKTEVDIALSTTGIAGPSGGNEKKPVGLVYIGIATDNNAYAIKSIFNGDRTTIQNRTTMKAFDELRKII
ncbi:MAG: competence/damage-inducible protein A [Tissierellia bacterium]|nr:competence/damage-inducible protein A [Tissierellia bacterium]